MKRFYNFKKDEKGFTLVELLVVIAILGVLAALAVPRVMGSLDDAQVKTCDANKKTIKSAVERYTATNLSSAPDPDQSVLENVYLAEWPTCPSGGNYAVGPDPDYEVTCTNH